MCKYIRIALVGLLLCSVLCFNASAENYSSTYPDIFNSGGPLWVYCNIEGMGDYCIVVDPNTNVQAFGFDAPTGYNLINNTGSTIYGRAYSVNSSTGYNARWASFYKLQLQTGTTSYGQTAWEDYNITKIYGTTFNLIDYHGSRGNDDFKYNMTENNAFLIISACVVAIVFLLVCSLVFKPRLFRM